MGLPADDGPAPVCHAGPRSWTILHAGGLDLVEDRTGLQDTLRESDAEDLLHRARVDLAPSASARSCTGRRAVPSHGAELLHRLPAVRSTGIPAIGHPFRSLLNSPGAFAARSVARTDQQVGARALASRPATRSRRLRARPVA